nr:hypothetical protein [Tanacetum cinerariifolium]
MLTEASRHDESPFLDAKLPLTESETESDNVASKIDIGDQDEGQARPNPGDHDEGQAGSNPEVQLMVSVLIHQDTSSIPLMTTPVIDLTTSQYGSPLPTSIATTLAVSKAVNEIVTDVVDWAMKAPLQARFSDLPAVDMKEILQQRMFEDKSYEAHEDHKKLYDALEKSLERDYLDKLLSGASGAPVLQEHQDLLSFPHLLLLYLLVHFSNDKDSGNDHLPTIDSRKDWWKPLHAKERPATPKPAWTISSSTISDAYEVVKAFYPDVIHLQFQMEECHKMLTDQVDWTNPKGYQVRMDVNRPLPLGGSPGHITIQKQFFFNKDLEYLRYGSKGSSLALSISKMNDVSYPNFEVRSTMRILSVVRIKAYSTYGYDYSSEIVLRRANFQEHTIAEKDFKNLYPNDFEDLNLLLLQGHLDHLPGYEFKHDYSIIESPRAVVFPVNNNERKIMQFNEIYKFSDGTLIRILKALAYRVKEFKIKRLNPGINTRFWTQKDVTRRKEFITTIERRLKMRRIYQNLECFVGGRVRDIDYILL